MEEDDDYLKVWGEVLIAALTKYHDTLFENGRQMVSVQDSKELIDEIKWQLTLKKLV